MHIFSLCAEFNSTEVSRDRDYTYHDGSIENEALENEERSTKHPEVENEAP